MERPNMTEHLDAASRCARKGRDAVYRFTLFSFFFRNCIFRRNVFSWRLGCGVASAFSGVIQEPNCSWNLWGPELALAVKDHSKNG